MRTASATDWLTPFCKKESTPGTQTEARDFGLVKLALTHAEDVLADYKSIPDRERAQFYAARAFYLISGQTDLSSTPQEEMAEAERLDANNALLAGVKAMHIATQH